MQLLELIAYGPNNFRAHKRQRWRLRKYRRKFPLKTKKNIQKPKQDAKGRRSRQREVGGEIKRKVTVRPRVKTWEERPFFGWGLCFFLP
jgi:hypothetical protein